MNAARRSAVLRREVMAPRAAPRVRYELFWLGAVAAVIAEILERAL